MQNNKALGYVVIVGLLTELILKVCVAEHSATNPIILENNDSFNPFEDSNDTNFDRFGT